MRTLTVVGIYATLITSFYSCGATYYDSPSPTTATISPRIRTYGDQQNQGKGYLRLSKIESFLDFPLVIENSNKLHKLGRIIANSNQETFSRKDSILYVTNLDHLPKNTPVDIVTTGDTVVNPTTKHMLGIELIKAGEGIIVSQGIVSKVLVTESIREITVGNYLLPKSTIEISGLTPIVAPSNAPEKLTQICSIYGDSSKFSGNLSIVSIGLGSKHGIKKGDVMFVYKFLSTYASKIYPHSKERKNQGFRFSSNSKIPKVIYDKKLVGEIMIISVFPDISYAIVKSAKEILDIGDMVTNKKDQ
ncbi:MULTISPECIES: hypothetical protein [Candidatus Ichthyocystis]|uniref:Putative exported protein n=1 Tax=Candidatus Ichthyocystis hellenicum TaxID=1561003 RepID=A0A0S4M1Q0_9BURK|nr:MULTISPECIES: hypothetical protein [Ichthyocystis]CUT17168.1 putative exported protein [Candidatus Ichthyocystis hellenicum]